MIVVVLVAAVVTLGYFGLNVGKSEPLPVLFDAPRYSWQNQEGQTVSSESMRSKVVLANFIFTNCTDICPAILTPKMLEQRDSLAKAGLLGKDVQLISFSVDPEHDTPPVLAEYAGRYGVEGTDWQFLTSSTSGEQEMHRVVVEGFHLAVQPLHDVHDGGDASAIAHSGQFVLIDKQNRVRALYDPAEMSPDDVLRDVRQLIAEGS